MQNPMLIPPSSAIMSPDVISTLDGWALGGAPRTKGTRKPFDRKATRAKTKLSRKAARRNK
jgi:hypothetical protein